MFSRTSPLWATVSLWILPLRDNGVSVTHLSIMKPSMKCTPAVQWETKVPVDDAARVKGGIIPKPMYLPTVLYCLPTKNY